MLRASCLFAVLLSLCLWLVACHGTPTPAANTEEESVRPGINDGFLAPDMEVATYEDRFEGDNREVFVQRARIAAMTGPQPGMRIADVGAGTGLYTRMFAPKVGAAGRVFAVEIAPKFVAHLRADAAERGLTNVEAVQCSARSIGLAAASVDLVFVCDTYHHFEYPRSTLASILRALRPGGELVIVDFQRIPGESSEWILGHVRADQEMVRAEVVAAGFEPVSTEPATFLRENYLLRFRRP